MHFHKRLWKRFIRSVRKPIKHHLKTDKKYNFNEKGEKMGVEVSEVSWQPASSIKQPIWSRDHQRKRRRRRVGIVANGEHIASFAEAPSDIYLRQSSGGDEGARPSPTCPAGEQIKRALKSHTLPAAMRKIIMWTWPSLYDGNNTFSRDQSVCSPPKSDKRRTILPHDLRRLCPVLMTKAVKLILLSAPFFFFPPQIRQEAFYFFQN